MSAAEATTVVLAEPVTATVLGVLILDERLGAPAALGAALVLAGLITLAIPGRRPGRAPRAVIEQ